MKNGAALCSIIVTVSTFAAPFDPYELYDLSSEGDLLVSDGRRMRIETIPFTQYFAKYSEARSDLDVIKDQERTYSAIWEIVDSMLYLTDAYVLRLMPDRPDTPEVMEAVLPELFPNQKQVFADWYTGYLIIPIGDPTISCYPNVQTWPGTTQCVQYCRA